MYLQIITFFVFLVLIQAEHCTTPNNEEGLCVPFNTCSVLYAAVQATHNASVEEFIKKSICGSTPFETLVCCGVSPNFAIGEDERYYQNSRLPSRQYCGYQHADDYFRAENDTSVRLNEFPWIAQIAKQVQILVNFEGTMRLYEFCTGSLINSRYVLTTVDCVVSSEWVRLGEFHVQNQTDCILEPPFDEECSDAVVNVGIDKRIFKPNAAADKIALLRLNETVKYSEYIRPICLHLSETSSPQIGDVLFTSGWTQIVDQNGRRQLVKKKNYQRIVSPEECSKTLIPENNMCTLVHNNNTDSTCYTDYGGPIMFTFRHQWYQAGIIHFDVHCKGNIPRIHTKVMNYIDWIQENLES